MRVPSRVVMTFSLLLAAGACGPEVATDDAGAVQVRPRDAGVRDDGGTSRIDAGVGLPDAGQIQTGDAGLVGGTDAGTADAGVTAVETDGGESNIDSGVVVIVDAGALFDAGVNGAGARILGLLPDGGDEAWLPDGGWDDLYVAPGLGACATGSVVIAPVVDPGCVTGLLDADRVVLASGEWTDVGASNSNYRQRALRIDVFSLDGGLAVPSRRVALGLDPAVCTARPAISQLGGRYGVGYVGYYSSSTSNPTYYPRTVVVGHDLSTMRAEWIAGQLWHTAEGGHFSSEVYTYRLSMQTSGTHFRLGFDQNRALRVATTGQIIFGNVLSTTAMAPGPSSERRAYDLVLAKYVSWYDFSRIIETGPEVAAVWVNAEQRSVAVIGQENAFMQTWSFTPSVDGGTVVAPDRNTSGVIRSSPDGIEVASALPDGGTRLVHLSARGVAGEPTEVPASGGLLESNGTRWLLGGTRAYDSNLTTLVATPLEGGEPLKADLGPTYGTTTLMFESRTDRVRLLLLVYEPIFSTPTKAHVVVTTWCK